MFGPLRLASHLRHYLPLIIAYLRHSSVDPLHLHCDALVADPTGVANGSRPHFLAHPVTVLIVHHVAHRLNALLSVLRAIASITLLALQSLSLVLLYCVRGGEAIRGSYH